LPASGGVGIQRKKERKKEREYISELEVKGNAVRGEQRKEWRSKLKEAAEWDAVDAAAAAAAKGLLEVRKANFRHRPEYNRYTH
jgi:hypothetical protein